MKTLILSILTLLVTGFSYSTNAQVAAVMQAKVEIISGAGFTLMEDAVIDLKSENLSNTIKAGSFSLVSAPGTDISVHIEENSVIKNEFGEIIELESLSVDKQSHESGQHDISVNGKVKNSQSLDGHYQGSITAVVEYL
ncbi:MAG: hypothetical protein WD357_10945 [Gracilimonas sp.]